MSCSPTISELKLRIRDLLNDLTMQRRLMHHASCEVSRIEREVVELRKELAATTQDNIKLRDELLESRVDLDAALKALKVQRRVSLGLAGRVMASENEAEGGSGE